MRWLENSYDAFLDFTAHHWWTIVLPSLGLLALTGWMLVERPKAFIPTEDQGYLIVVDPDARRHQPRGRPPRIAKQVGRSAQELEGVSDVVSARRLQRDQLDQPDQRGHRLRDPRGVVEAQGRRSCARRPWPGRSRRQLRKAGPRRRGAGAPAAADPRAEPDRRLRVHDRGPRRQGRRGPGAWSPTASSTRPASAPSWPASSRRSRPACPSSGSTSTAPRPSGSTSPVSDVFAVLQTNLGGLYVNDFNLYGKVWKVMIQAEGDAPDQARRHRRASTSSTAREARCPSSSLGEVELRPRRRSTCRTTTCTPPPRSPASPPPGYSSGQAIARHGGGRRRGPARGLRLRVDRHHVPGAEDRQRRPPTSSPCRSSASSCSWRPSTRAGSARW